MHDISSGAPVGARGTSPDRAARSAPNGGVHFVPEDGRRFPLCGSWRSNWNHTGDPDRATCAPCRARLAAEASARDGGDGR